VRGVDRACEPAPAVHIAALASSWSKADRMQDFTAAVLPVLGQLLQRLAAEPSESPELASLMHTVLKIFWSCVYINVPSVLTKDLDQARLWLRVRCQLLTAI
jgi:hypothetical protein